MRSSLKVGLVGTSMDGFNTQRAEEDFKKSADMLQKLGKNMGFELRVIPKSVKTPQDAQKVVDIIQSEKVDFVLVQNNTVSSGDIAKILGTLDVNFGIWALPEPQMNELPLASVTAMNMFSGIWTHFFKNREIPFKWFFGPAQSDQFQKPFGTTITALSTVKSVSNSRIGLIGDVAPGFYDVFFDERVLYSKWGVTVGRHEVSEVVSRAEKVAHSEVEKIIDTALPPEKCKGLSESDREKTIRLYLAFKQIIQEGNYDALAVRCWFEFQQLYSIAVCASISLLGEDNIPVACEGDVVGALSMLILHYLNNNGSVILTDLNTVDPEDNSLLMWHCGCAPSSWAVKNQGRYCPHSLFGLGVVYDISFSPQPTTIASLAEDGENILVATADIVDESKPGYKGGRGWFTHLKMQGTSITVLDFLETIVRNGFSHHFAITQGNVEPLLDELIFWKNLKYLPLKSYRE